MDPLVTKEIPSIPEEQSPTLMIECVLSDLMSDVETVETHEVEEKERSRSTLGIDDHGRGNDDENQTEVCPEEQTEL